MTMTTAADTAARLDAEMRRLPASVRLSEHDGCTHRKIGKGGKSMSAIAGKTGICTLCGSKPTSRVVRYPLQPSAKLSAEVERLWRPTIHAYNHALGYLMDLALSLLDEQLDRAKEYADSEGHKRIPMLPSWEQMEWTTDADGKPQRAIPKEQQLYTMLGREWAAENPLLLSQRDGNPDCNRHMQHRAIRLALTTIRNSWNSRKKAREKVSSKRKQHKQANKRTRRTASEPLHRLKRLMIDPDAVLAERQAGERAKLPLGIGIGSSQALTLIDSHTFAISPIRDHTTGKALAIKSRYPLPLSMADQIACFEIVETTKKLTRRTRHSERTFALHLTLRVSPPQQEVSPRSRPVGIDVGITNTLTTSDGIYHHRPQQDKEQRKQKQRAKARCKNGSRKHKRLAREIRKDGEKHRNRQTDWENKTAAHLADKYTAFIYENLAVSSMMASAAGGKMKKGKNVKAKTGLNREMATARPAGVIGKIADNFEGRGKPDIAIAAPFTSQTCHCCRQTDKDNRGKGKHHLVFACRNEECGNRQNADHNAAINIMMSYLHPYTDADDDRAAGQEISSDASPSRNCESAVLSGKQPCPHESGDADSVGGQNTHASIVLDAGSEDETAGTASGSSCYQPSARVAQSSNGRLDGRMSHEKANTNGHLTTEDDGERSSGLSLSAADP